MREHMSEQHSSVKGMMIGGVIGLIIAILYLFILKGVTAGGLVVALRFAAPVLVPGVFIAFLGVLFLGIAVNFLYTGIFLTIILYVVVGGLFARRRFFVACAIALIAIGVAFSSGITAGIDLNQEAWEHSFSERSLPVPPDGPREGYWGSRLNGGKKVFDPVTLWREPAVEVPGFLSVDKDGLQHATTENAQARLLFAGASVAFGAYASTEENAYFVQLQKLLAQRGLPIDIAVVATGAWKSAQSVKAVKKFFDQVSPDVVIAFNGLNGLILGEDAYTLADGSKVADIEPEVRESPDANAEERVKFYLENMAEEARFVLSKGARMVFALQPALFEKKPLSFFEKKLLYASLLGLKFSAQDFRSSYYKTRSGLSTLAEHEAIDFLDLSRAFDGQEATTFADIYHFSDPGHRIIAEKMADFLEPIIREVIAQQ